MTFAGAQDFNRNARQNRVTVREFAIATAAAVAVFAAGYTFVQDFTATPANAHVATKSDRVPLAGESVCAGQAWGAWSQDCLEKFATDHGAENLRLIPTRTVEVRDVAARTSTLVRGSAN